MYLVSITEMGIGKLLKADINLRWKRVCCLFSSCCQDNFFLKKVETIYSLKVFYLWRPAKYTHFICACIHVAVVRSTQILIEEGCI